MDLLKTWVLLYSVISPTTQHEKTLFYLQLVIVSDSPCYLTFIK